MSIAARQAIVNSHNIIFRSPEQRDDIVNLHGVQTQLISFLTYMVRKSAIFEVTALKSDHHDDSDLNPVPPHCGTHGSGWAIDCWPLYKPEEGAYIDATAPEFQHFLRLAAQGPFFYQTGLGGSSYTALNEIAAGVTAFWDGYTDESGNRISEDHVHFGCHS